MGCHPAIRHDSFPKQGTALGKRCLVCFHYDTANAIKGKVVRDDYEAPFDMIIQLDDGRFVRSSECQYSYES
jgi:hypothetical protein